MLVSSCEKWQRANLDFCIVFGTNAKTQIFWNRNAHNFHSSQIIRVASIPKMLRSYQLNCIWEIGHKICSVQVQHIRQSTVAGSGIIRVPLKSENFDVFLKIQVSFLKIIYSSSYSTLSNHKPHHEDDSAHLKIKIRIKLIVRVYKLLQARSFLWL